VKNRWLASCGRLGRDDGEGGVSESQHLGVDANWKRKYQGMEVSDVRAMRAMTEEIICLKRIVADQVVQIDILKAVNAKKW
jgi:hypothetical protein